MAVYTDVSFEELELFLASYDLGHAHVFKGIAEGVSNSNYYLQTSTGAYILTLYEKRVERDDLPFYLGLMEHLARAGHQVPDARSFEGRQAHRHSQRAAGGDPHVSRRRVAAAAARSSCAARPDARWRSFTTRARVSSGQRANSFRARGMEACSPPTARPRRIRSRRACER